LQLQQRLLQRLLQLIDEAKLYYILLSCKRKSLKFSLIRNFFDSSQFFRFPDKKLLYICALLFSIIYYYEKFT